MGLARLAALDSQDTQDSHRLAVTRTNVRLYSNKPWAVDGCGGVATLIFV